MRKQGLSSPNRWIVEQCQLVNFGAIRFRVKDGQPDVDGPWSTRQTVKLAGGDNGARHEFLRADFVLRVEQAALITQLSAMAGGTHVTVEVRHGLPFTIEIERSATAA